MCHFLFKDDLFFLSLEAPQFEGIVLAEGAEALMGSWGGNGDDIFFVDLPHAPEDFQLLLSILAVQGILIDDVEVLAIPFR